MTTPELIAIAATAEQAAAITMSLRPPLEAVWAALARVPDPELPVVSIVELGIVREVRWEEGTDAETDADAAGAPLVVRVTPTYSGCPATDVIQDDIRAALREIGVEALRIDIALAPAWTTDWIAPEARSKLRDFGIAPPGAAVRIDVTGLSALRRKTVVPCPRCASTATTLIAQFGSTACKALYRCDICREPFDYFKPF